MVKAADSFSASSVIRPLVVGIEPFPGECLSSLLVRACEANVFTKTSHLLALIGLRAQASEAVPFTHTNTGPALAALLGTTADEIDVRMHPAVKDALGRTTIDWFGSSIERRHVEATVRRFAPRSLESNGHFPAVWGVRLLDYCPITLEYFHSTCPQCSRTLGWRACRSLTKCEKCGASLLRAASRTVPPQFRAEARLGASLVSPVANDREGAVQSLPDPFRTWAPADALFGLVTLGEAQLWLENSSKEIVAVGSAAQISAGIEFARGWPESMSRFASISMKRSNSTSVQLGLGRLGKIFRVSAVNTPVGDLVRSTISMAMGEAKVPAKLHRGGFVNRACRDGMLTALEASRQLGIAGRNLRKLEGRSETFLTRQNVKGGVALYDKARVLRLLDVINETVKTEVCARQLGIPHYCLDAFAAAQLVSICTDRDAEIVTGHRLISKSSITSLRERVRKQRSTLNGGVTLRDAMRQSGHPQGWVDIFNSMLSGDIGYRFSGSDDISLSDAIWIKADSVRQLPPQSAGPDISGVTISCQMAAEIIGTTAQFVSAAVKIGILEGSVGLRNYALPLTDVLEFQRSFVLTEELRNTFGQHQKSISCHLRKAGMEPAATINRTRVWRRSDIQKYIEMQSDTCRAVFGTTAFG